MHQVMAIPRKRTILGIAAQGRPIPIPSLALYSRKCEVCGGKFEGVNKTHKSCEIEMLLRNYLKESDTVRPGRMR